MWSLAPQVGLVRPQKDSVHSPVALTGLRSHWYWVCTPGGMRIRQILRSDARWCALVAALLSTGCALESESNIETALAPSELREAVSDCGGSVVESAPVALRWDETRSNKVAPLVLQNTLDERVETLVTVSFRGANFRPINKVFAVTLDPLETTTLAIQTSALDDLLSSSDTPATVDVSAETGGTTAWSPQMAIAKNATGKGYKWLTPKGAELHSKEVIASRLKSRGAELTDYESDVTGSMQVVAASKSFGTSPKASPIGVFGAPPSRDQTVCFFLGTNFTQGGVDFASQRSYPARGMKVWLSVPSIGTVFGMTDRETGCVSFPAVDSGNDFYMGMYFESHTGSSANRNIMTRAFDVAGSPWSLANFNGSPWDVPRNAFVITSSGAGSTTNLTSHPANWRMANLLAVANEMLAFYDNDAGDGQNFSRSLTMEAANCASSGVGSCASTSHAWVTDEDNGVRKAELIGHEVGHVVEGLYSPDSLHYDYGIDDNNPACDGYGEAHALYSREWQIGAIKEGLASALGAFALSSSSTWKYYKSIPSSNGLYTNQVIDLEDASEFRYLENECGCEKLDCLTGFGVEVDWIRFFWDWWSVSNNSFQTRLTRIGTAASVMTDSNVFEPLRSQVPAGFERAVFDSRAATHGIDH